ncbi:YidC/Oxa1 family membrane protein insertase [Candidatus Phytoplasma rubi]|uniref:YidC/Oxa1 family membrane protein insertase n=1 Tax=Candidatus Phytoplasma rubi TaxID=399025 RepID=A0ABY7BUN8_9MOLU|nr:YidC/Oxa1 family membrane protein insertase [Candidatus Phytoplasma rubi]WAN63652.1 YidC/Oxa1 family membrane protein insertase [Candidatus Phytoplasma rubi]
MNNIQNKKMKLFQNFFIVLILSLILLFVIRSFGPKQINYKKLQDQNIKIIFNKNECESIKDYEEFKKNIESNNNLDFAFKDNRVSIFFFGFDKKSKNIILEKLEKKPSENSKEAQQIINKVKNKIKEELETKDVFYFTEKLSPKEEKSQIQDFLTIKTGTNQKDFHDKYKKLNNSKLKIGKIKDNKIKIKENYSVKICDKYKKFITEEKSYNEIIKTKINKDNNEINVFNLEYGSENGEKKYLEIFVDDTGNLPIQWPNKIEWYFFLGWGYIWNVLVVFIGYFLYFFSFMFIGEGWFFGNLGLGIVLTTLLIRTLSWPIYTKASTFSMNMSLAQPEINKIQEKYALKKDRESMQKMQMEIFKVYRKHNFSIFGIFISFLQMPILIAIFRTLNRFRNPGGIFPVIESKTLFLGCINLGQETNNNIWLNLSKIVLSLIVGISMYILNKINLQKPSYLKKNVQILNNEQKMKQKNQEMTMKIVNYVMIIFMVINAFNDSALSLYWITGNLYTILQITMNRKKMEKKYNILKNKSF